MTDHPDNPRVQAVQYVRHQIRNRQKDRRAVQVRLRLGQGTQPDQLERSRCKVRPA